MERRRQELENARRQRLADAQRRAAAGQPQGAGNAAAFAANAANAAGGRSDPSGRTDAASQTRDPNARPSLEELISMIPKTGRGAGSGVSTTAGGTGSTGSTRSGSSSGLGGGSNSGTAGGGGGSGPVLTTGNGSGPVTTQATARWLPVDNRSCGGLVAGMRTNDLFLRLTTSTQVVGVDSPAGTGLMLTGGAFFQDPRGSNVNPTSTARAASGCVEFDSFLNDFGVVSPTSSNLVFSDRLVATWFNFAGVIGEQSTTKFGDSAFYVFLGRFTAPTTITNLSGTLSVGIGAAGANFRSVNVSVPFVSELWAFNAQFGLPPSTSNPGSGNPPPPSGGGTTPPGGGTSPPPSGGGTTPPPSGGGGTPPPSGGGTTPPTGGGTTPPPSGDPALVALWLPVNNSACSEQEPDENGQSVTTVDLAGYRTADLFLRLGSAYSLQYVVTADSAGPPAVQSVRVSNGSFFQHPAVAPGVFTRPSAVSVAARPCLAFDSFLAIDTQVSAGAGNIQAFQVTWDARLEGIWVVPGFGASSALPAAKDTVRFPGDPDGYYVRIARFTVTNGSSISGVLDAGIVKAGTGQTMQVQVTVPNCPTCFAPPAP